MSPAPAIALLILSTVIGVSLLAFAVWLGTSSLRNEVTKLRNDVRRQSERVPTASSPSPGPD